MRLAGGAVAEIRALGGDEVICTEDEDLHDRVTEITGKTGVTKSIDCVSGQLGADVSRRRHEYAQPQQRYAPSADVLSRTASPGA